MLRSTALRSSRRPLAVLTSVLLSLFWLSAGPLASPARANSSGSAVVGGFEIDGNFYEGTANTTTATGPTGDPVDWGSTDIKAKVDVVQDPIGADPTVYSGGSKEDDLPGWADESSAQAPGKGDIGNLYVYDRLVSGAQHLYLGFERESSTGTVTYFLELNQAPNTQNQHGALVPARTAGDLRVALTQSGNGDFSVSSLTSWSGSTFQAVTVPVGSFALAVNDSPVRIGGLPKWTNTLRGAKQFVEVSFDLTTLGVDLDCPSTGFTSAFLRSQSSKENANPELKDFTTGPISVPSTCSQLMIEKRAKTTTGALLAGATFSISPNPFVGQDPTAAVDVTDGGTGDADGSADGTILVKPAKPGTYTVTEKTPPDGYLKTTTPKQVVAAPYADTPAVVVFTNNLVALTWTKTDTLTRARICGATFELRRVADVNGVPVNDAAVVVVDRCSTTDPVGYDQNLAPGVFQVTGLKTGTFELVETQAPAGYTGDSGAVRTVKLAAATTSAGTFTNTRRAVELTLPKLFEGGAAPGVSATFTLYQDVNKDGVLALAEATGGTASTTDAAGRAHFNSVPWGDTAYYVIRETGVPTGFSPVPDIAVNLAQYPSDGLLTLGVVTDPRRTVAVTLPKAFEGERSPYSVSATFTLFRDVDDDGVLDAAERVGGVPATTGSDGTATWQRLGWGPAAHYVVRETGVPAGFAAIPDVAFDLPAYPASGTYDLASLNNGKAYVDARALAAVTLSKLGRTVDGDTSPLAGSTFVLCTESGVDAGTFDTDGDKPCVAPTSGAGSSSMTWSALAWGSDKTYWLVETATPAGYQPVSPVEVDLSAHPAGGTRSVTATDERRTVSVNLSKQDGGPTPGTSLDNSPLASAGFTLFGESGATPGYQGEEDTTPVAGPEAAGDDGSISWSGLAWGPGRVYYAVETTVPVGYQAVAAQRVDLTAYPADGTYSIGTLVDERVPFTLRLAKFDGGYGTASQTPLAGAGFTLYTNRSCDPTVDEGDLVVEGEHASSADGSVPPWAELTWGTCYVLVETHAPAGFGAVANIVVDASNGYPRGGVLTYDANDPRLLARIDVTKHDGSIEGPTLAGAWFELRDVDGAVVREATQTGQNGTVSFTGLPWGTRYVLHETVAPQGYDLVPDQVVDLSSYPMGGVVTVDVPDPRLPVTITLVKKDGFDGTDLGSAVFTLYAESGDATGYQPAQDTTVAGGPASMVDGRISFGALDWGRGKTYHAVETTTPTGYATVDPITVVLSTYPEGGTYAIRPDVVDARLPVTLELRKQGTSPADQPNVNLGGVGFTLYRDTGDGVLDEHDVRVGHEQVTSASGATSWAGLTWGAGQVYLLHESTPRPGYARVADQVVDLTAYPASGQGTVSYTLVDIRQRAELTVSKSDGDTGLAGATFDLHRDDGDGQLSAGTDPVVESCTTVATGRCSVRVDWGSSYFWFERTAPAGFNLPTQQWQGPVEVNADNVTTAFAATRFADTRTGITTTPSAGPVVIAPQPGTSDSVTTLFDSATLTGLSRDATGTVGFQLFGPFGSSTAVACDTTPVFTSSGNPISLVGATGAFVAVSEVFTPKAAGRYQWRATYTGDAKNLAIAGTCPDTTEQAMVSAGPGPKVGKTADPASGAVVQPNGSITYTVTAANAGDVPIAKGSVVDTLPEHVTAVPGSVSDGGVLSADGRTVSWSVDLAPTGSRGASRQLTYRVTVDPAAPRGADLVNRVVFLGQQAATTHRTPTGDLTIVKTNSPSGAVAYGDSLAYTLQVTASGTLTQTGVVVSDYLPGLDPADPMSLRSTYTTGSARCDGSCTVGFDPATSQLTWQLGSIDGGSSRTLSFTVTVDRPAAAADGSIAAGEVRNAAVVGSAQTRPTASNQVVNPVTAVPPRPTGSLSIVKANDPTTSVAYGDTIRYAMRVTATGTLDQTGVVVTDVLPGYDAVDPTSVTTTLTAGSASCDVLCTVAYDESAHSLRWSLGDLAAGTTRTVSFAVRVDRPRPAPDGSIAPGEVRNSALVQSVQSSPTRSNRVVNPVTAVLGVRISNPPPAVQPVAFPPAEPALPRTGPGAPIGLTLWWAGLLITTGLGLTVANARARRRTEQRC